MNTLRWFFIHPLRTWSLFLTFLLICTYQPGGPNASSRLYSMANFVEEGNPRIDAYHSLTIDWARTPEGHYYSNKAPGPILLGLPAFWVVDKQLTRGLSDRKARDTRRIASIAVLDRLLSFILQTVPLFLLCAVWLQRLRKAGVRISSLNWFALALLLGNTLTLMTSAYYGHAMTAAFLLAMALALWRDSVFGAFLFWGFAVLCEYSVAVVGLPLFLALSTPIGKKPLQAAFQILTASLLPGALWIAYHTYCFGGPFNLPVLYQNPDFVDKAQYALWGVFGLPDLRAAVSLLIGPSRGLLWTQPWILILLCLPVLYSRPQDPRSRIAFVTVTSFYLLLVINAAFGNWDAGAVAGARYLSPVFGLFALLIALYWKTFSTRTRSLLKAAITLGASFQIFWLSMATFPTNDALWYQAWKKLSDRQNGSENLLALTAIATLVFLIFREKRGFLSSAARRVD